MLINFKFLVESLPFALNTALGRQKLHTTQKCVLSNLEISNLE